MSLAHPPRRQGLLSCTVTAVALDVGYSSLSSFIHAFRRRFGVTPSYYQNRARFDKS